MAAAGRSVSAGRRSVKDAVEDLFSIPDNDVGWLIPAILQGVVSARQFQPDVIYSSAPPWTGQLVAAALAFVLGRPWIADFRDPWARGPWRGDRPAVARRAALDLERLTVRRADALLFTTEALHQEVVAHHGPWLAEKCHVVRNGCDPDELVGLCAATGDGRFTLAHVGTLYGGRDPLPLLRAIAAAIRAGSIRRDRFRLRLVGAVALAGRDLASTCRELGLTDVVELVARVSRRESLEVMCAADALLLVQPGHPLSVPGKLYEYFAARKPILALAEGETADLIRATRSGIVVSPPDERAIGDALVALVHGRLEWAPASPVWFDGRLRAREMTAVVERLSEPVLRVVHGATARVGRQEP
jgi:glycosyltransferase involved in cell wall biosynthesis